MTNTFKVGGRSMWRFLTTSWGLILTLGLCFGARSQESAPVLKVMSLKLDYTQQVLVSIIKQEYDELEALSFRLVVLTGTEDWKVIRTEEYNRYTAEFVSAVEALRKTRSQRDIGESANAYIDMTLSCVHCHKYVRDYKDTLEK